MADRSLAQLNYEIGADLSKLDLSINEANRLIRDFTKQAGKSGAEGLAKLNNEVLKLTQYREGLKQIGLPQDLPDNVKRSTTALTSLNQVVQDLPFGFIGIQNNIPNLVQQFALLTKENNGFKGALSAVAGAITGPIGLVFGVSLLTTGVTALTQKYGSLSNAFQAILGIQSQYNKDLQKLNKSYQEYNDSKRTSLQLISEEVATVSANITEVQTLLGIISDQTKSYDERNAALNRLKSINKDYFGNLDLEKTKIEELTKAGQGYIDFIKQAAVTKGFEQEISSTSVELAKQVGLLDKLQKERDDIARKPVKFIGKADLQIDRKELDAATSRVNEQNKKVNDLRNTISLFNKELEKSIIAENKIKAPIDAANEAFKQQDEANKKTKKSLEDRLKQEQDYEKYLIYRANLEDDLNRQRLKGVMTTNIQIGKDTKDNLIRYGELQTKVKPLQFFDIVSYQEAVTKFEDKIKSNPPKATIDIVPPAAGEISKELQARLDLFNQNYEKAKQLGITVVQYDEMQRKSFLETGKVIYSNIINPLNELFDIVLSKGEKSWENFTKSVVESLKKLLVKLAAAAALAAILSAISGGASNVSGGGVGFFQAFTSLLGFKGGSIANPSFGGVQPGGMAMNGAVNLVLRGQDLVGSINRTNSQISRIG